MSRRAAVLRVGVALLAVVTIATAAATVGSVVEPTHPGENGDDVDEDVLPIEVDGDQGDPGLFQGWWFLQLLVVLLVVALLILTLYYLLFDDIRISSLVGVSIVVALFVLLIAYGFDPAAFDPAEAPQNVGDIEEFVAGGDGDGGEGIDETNRMPAGWWIVMLGLGAILLVVAMFGRRSKQEGESRHDEPAQQERLSDVAAAAGRAADRIENEADVDNEVYRAWKEMTALLEVDEPATRTPREFASAGVQAGMDPGDVERLTRLFEDVRYGRRRATSKRENRAVTVLRRIESSTATDREEP